jgi:16S rRNA (guanine966-N2)-methyltransferase
MRIITGMYKGRTLKTVPDLSVRPATERVRQTIFNMLVNRIDFEGIQVLDLFAGSGSLGFEALSRGARRVVFVERDSLALTYLEENARTLHCLESVEIFSADAIQYLRTSTDRFGVVFADPPYAFADSASLPGTIFSCGRVEADGYLLMEHASTLHFTDDFLYAAGPEKKFGRTVVTFFQARKDHR